MNYSTRNLAWSVMLVEQLLLFRLNFPFKLLAKFLALTVSFEVCCCLPQGFVHLNLTAASSSVTFPVHPNSLSWCVTVMLLGFCTVQATSAWVSPERSTSVLHLCICLSPIVSVTFIPLFLPFIYSVFTSHDTTLMDHNTATCKYACLSSNSPKCPDFFLHWNCFPPFLCKHRLIH